jgi:predicted nucleic acid-binding protein
MGGDRAGRIGGDRAGARAGQPCAPKDGREALADLAGLDIARYPHDQLLPRVWELRTSVTAYDAVYLALAEVLEAPLLTLDRRLARVRGHGARVEVP